MSYILRLNFICWVILFAVSSRAFPAFYEDDSQKIPNLRRITINSDTVNLLPPDPKEREVFLRQKLTLDYRKNNITFELTKDENILYQYFLNGFDKEWSPWKQSCYKEYTNLPAGQYIFQARCKRSGYNGVIISEFRFRILPLWYFSKTAIILYLIFVLLSIKTLVDHLNLLFARKQYTLEQIINKRTEDLIIEKEKTETLLANVLPKNTADEIMAKGKATKMKYNFVTVLFSDIQGFTKIAEEMNPEILIDELDKFFFYFDSVVEKFSIEKIKTIGDAYMCAGGIPEKNRTNPVEVILAALEMKAYMIRLKDNSHLDGMKNWDIRIGIHTGTVIAGVVGQKKLSYDIWGDTVNIASRMESSGEAGKINISGTTHEFVKDFFDCEFRGKMPVKYKGELEMYFVNGIIPELCDNNGGPNRKFIVKMQMIKLQDVEEMITKLFHDEAPPNLYFNNASLLRNISNHVELLSTAENLNEEDFINLKLASVFLLSGFIYDYEKPMEASFRLVEEILPKFGFEQENIESTKKIISNSYSERQESPLDNILHDARYDYLGRVDYLKLTDRLLRERTEYGMHTDSKTWKEVQRKLLSDHEFITKTARLLRSVQADEQIAALEVFSE